MHWYNWLLVAATGIMVLLSIYTNLRVTYLRRHPEKPKRWLPW